MPLFNPPLTLAAAIARAREALADISDTARLDAEILARHVSGASRAHTVAYPEQLLSDTACHLLGKLVERRRQGEPIAYLVGAREFWSLDLVVSPATLIPRPETELLVERALTHIPLDAACSVADLGTGSGAIAIAIARERPFAHVVATDIAEPTLAVARTNARRFGATNIRFQLSDWFAALGGQRFDVIVSNPPYVRASDPHLLAGDLRFEPRVALDGGADGLAAVAAIVSGATAQLTSSGRLFVEHGFDQASDVRNILTERGFRRIVTYKDLAGRERVTEARAP
jgi:release factor glutamine methyltransferase